MNAFLARFCTKEKCLILLKWRLSYTSVNSKSSYKVGYIGTFVVFSHYSTAIGVELMFLNFQLLSSDCYEIFLLWKATATYCSSLGLRNAEQFGTILFDWCRQLFQLHIWLLMNPMMKTYCEHVHMMSASRKMQSLVVVHWFFPNEFVILILHLLKAGVSNVGVKIHWL